MQIPYLARHFRVRHLRRPRATAGRTGPPIAAAYGEREYAADALAVLDATGTEQAVDGRVLAGRAAGPAPGGRAPGARHGAVLPRPSCLGRRASPCPNVRDTTVRRGATTPTKAGRSTTATTGSATTQGFVEFFFSRMLHGAALDEARSKTRSAGGSRRTPETLIADRGGAGPDAGRRARRSPPEFAAPSSSSTARTTQSCPSPEGVALAEQTGGRLVDPRGLRSRSPCTRPREDQPAPARVRRVGRMSVLEAQREQTRARYPDDEGYVEREGVRVFYEVYGDGEPTVFLLPTWSIVHSRYWKMQIPYFARHFRVLTFDGRGNGKADRPSGIAAYTEWEFAEDSLAVMDATGTETAVVVGFSCGALWGTVLAADHPGPRPGRRVHRPLRAARAGAPGAERPLLRGPPRHRRGLGEVQPPLLARALRGVPRVLLREDVQRAPFDEADRGLRRLGPRDRRPRR